MPPARRQVAGVVGAVVSYCRPDYESRFAARHFSGKHLQRVQYWLFAQLPHSSVIIHEGARLFLVITVRIGDSGAPPLG
jgi:hypothetical protein